MRKIVQVLKQRWVISLIGLIALSLLIWFGGPLIAIAGSVPLESPVVRLLVILIVFVIWGLSNLWLILKSNKQNNQMIDDIGSSQAADQSAFDSERTEEESRVLKERFDQALAVLKKAKLAGGENRLYELPWYIIIGPPGAGKTTALVNSDLHFPLADQFGKGAIQGVGGTRNCDWWFTDEAVLVDTAGRYTTQDTHQQADAAAWGSFMELLRKHRRKRPINGVIVAISVSDLLQQTEFERSTTAQAIRRRIQELTEKLHVSFPIYLLLTKADLIAGFIECFDDLGRDERAQTWGITFPLEVSHQPEEIKAKFEEEFNRLVSRLNERLLWRLHHERDFNRRGQILTFPQRVANLRPVIAEFIEQVFRTSRFEEQAILRGVYFTSGTQEGTPIDRLLASVSRTFGIDYEAAAPFAGPGKSFFLTRLFSEVIFPEAEITGGSQRVARIGRFVQIGAYAAAILVTVGAALGFAISFTRNDSSIQTTMERIAAYEKTPLPDPRVGLTRNLAALGAIRNVSDVYADRFESTPFLSDLGLYVGRRLGPAADGAYTRVLQATLLPDVLRNLETQMRDESRGLGPVYNALMIYLSFTDTEKMDRNKLRAWTVGRWGQRFSKDAVIRDKLTAHLDFFLARQFAPPRLSEPRIREAQRIVCRASPAEQILRRIYEIIAAMGLAPFKLAAARGTGRRILISRSGRTAINTIPGIFTREGYDAFIRVGVPEIPKMFAQIARICRLKSRLGLAGLAKLRARVQDLYFNEYSQRWEDLRADVGLVRFTDIAHGAQVLTTLSGPRSPLRNLLLAYQQHTSLGVDPNAAAGVRVRAPSGRVAGAVARAAARNARSLAAMVPGASVRSRFQPVRALVRGSENSPAPVVALMGDVQVLRDHMTAIASAPSMGAAAVDAARLRFDRKGRDLIGRVRDVGRRQIQPVKQIMEAAARNSWGAILQGSRVSINQVWRDEVLPAFAKLEARFPLTPKSSREARLVDFARFFRPDGIIDGFIKSQLGPFVVMRGRWSLRRIDGLTIGIPGDTLQQFRRARRITTALFPDGAQAPTVRFSLSPVVLDDRANRFTLTMDGQDVSYRHGPIRPAAMVWPGPQQPGHVRLVFTNRSGREVRQTIDGDWAWFRLLTPDRIRRTNREDRLLVTFKLSGMTAVYQITTASLTNPFDATSALFRFRAPKRL